MLPQSPAPASPAEPRARFVACQFILFAWYLAGMLAVTQLQAHRPPHPAPGLPAFWFGSGPDLLAAMSVPTVFLVQYPLARRHQPTLRWTALRWAVRSWGRWYAASVVTAAAGLVAWECVQPLNGGVFDVADLAAVALGSAAWLPAWPALRTTFAERRAERRDAEGLDTRAAG